MEHAKRNAFTELCRAGRITADLAKVLKYPWTTVYDVCKRYDRSRDFSRATNKPRRDRKLVSSPFNGLKRSVKVNPTTRMTILAKKRGVNRTIEKGLVKLKLTSFVQGKRHLLTGRMKGIRLHRCKRLISWMKDN